MGMKICFIGHKKHTQTRSSDFFLNEFRDEDIDTYFIDESNYDIFTGIEKEAYDLAICWQYDFLAQAFLARNIPTVVIPMYDGSFGYPRNHWKLLRGARIVNFSWWLHALCMKSQLDTMHVTYYPNPSDYDQVDFDNGLNGFLWQRRPGEVNWRTVVADVSDGQLDKLHLHTAMDDSDAINYLPTKIEKDHYNITTSEWFERKGDLNRVVDQSNIFFAPRRAEGIGMALLEAMSRGMMCIVHDEPTHNEYIANWINGVLYYAHHPVRIDLSNAEKMGRRARQCVFEGHHQWVQNIPSMKDFILSTPKPNTKIIKGFEPRRCLAREFFIDKNYTKKLTRL